MTHHEVGTASMKTITLWVSTSSCLPCTFHWLGESGRQAGTDGKPAAPSSLKRTSSVESLGGLALPAAVRTALSSPRKALGNAAEFADKFWLGNSTHAYSPSWLAAADIGKVVECCSDDADVCLNSRIVAIMHT